ncbi:hypothetical protein E1B28_010210 [Marasmius oreades]|uniref:PIN domain-like protein n=1 Tax=Marasmius oreades TaxID=181124 RepID=A0A9P7UQX0_9AGAR|nr:uncharacterized protein E1B28_010210 [Marasmius oreades]KAG7091157.1 hypothetical protein E1B28_010210 [Marasmius oreades]
MGVLGLTPFLQKTIPKAINLLPKRLKNLAGKTIVFDGTLITQRLHFAQLPHPYRHVLGWYRIIKELDHHNVHAICVFDGKDRIRAKAREALRRKQARRLANARQIIERERLKRLVQVRSVLSKVDWNDSAQRTRLAETLKIITLEKPSMRPFEDPIDDDSLWLDHSDPVVQSSFTDVSLPSDEDVLTSFWVTDHTYIDIDEQELNSILQDITNTSEVPPSSRVTTPQPTPPPDTYSSILVSLYTEYRNSISKLTSVSRASPIDDTESDKSEEYEMSKTQHQLTREEGDFWDAVAFSPPLTLLPTPTATPTPDILLTTLTKKSDLLSESYKRRAHPPTPKHYTQVKELIRAMGVPCIDSKGPFEAEALASSIVLNGFADYVASEDTDVLIYGAPLLRNISNRREPLLSFAPGTEIQHLLGLSSRDMLIDFALLLGTDFTRRIKNVGPSRALKLIRTYQSIEKVLESEEMEKFKEKHPIAVLENKDAHLEYLEEVDAGRKVFKTIPPVPNSLAMGAPAHRDEEKIVNLMGKYGLSSELEGYGPSHSLLKGDYFGDNPNNDDAVVGF